MWPKEPEHTLGKKLLIDLHTKKDSQENRPLNSHMILICMYSLISTKRYASLDTGKGDQKDVDVARKHVSPGTQQKKKLPKLLHPSKCGREGTVGGHKMSLVPVRRTDVVLS